MVSGYVDQASVRLQATDNVSAVLKRVQNQIAQTITRAVSIGPAITKAFAGVTQRIGDIGKSVTNVGSAISGVGTKLAIFGGIGAAGFGKSIVASADFAESMNRFKAIFGDQAGAAEDFAERLATSVRRSKSEIIGGLSDFGGFASGLGLAQEETRKLSEELVSLATDFGSFNNVGTDDSILKLLSAMSGEVEPVKRYGIDVSATALALRGIGTEATQSAKAMERLKIIRETLGRQGAIGDAEKTAYSASNSMKAFSSSLIDLKIAAGSALEGPFTNFLNSLVGITSQVTSWVSVNPQLVAAIAASTVGITAFGAAVTAAGIVLGAMGTIISTVAAALGLILSPLGLITGALAGGAALWLQFTDVGQNASKVIGEGLKFVQSQFGMLIDLIRAGEFQTAFQVVTTSANVVWQTFLAVLKTSWIRVSGFIESVWRQLGFKIVQLFETMILKVQTLMNGALETFNHIMPESLRLPTFDVSATQASLSALQTASREAMDEIQNRMSAGIDAAQAPAEAARKAWESAQQAARDALSKANSARSQAVDAAVKSVAPEPTVIADAAKSVVKGVQDAVGAASIEVPALMGAEVFSQEGFQKLIGAMNTAGSADVVQSPFAGVREAIAGKLETGIKSNRGSVAEAGSGLSGLMAAVDRCNSIIERIDGKLSGIPAQIGETVGKEIAGADGVIGLPNQGRY